MGYPTKNSFSLASTLQSAKNLLKTLNRGAHWSLADSHIAFLRYKKAMKELRQKQEHGGHESPDSESAGDTPEKVSKKKKWKLDKQKKKEAAAAKKEKEEAAAAPRTRDETMEATEGGDADGER